MSNLKFKLKIAYEGTAYEGWQVQKIGTGVQEKVEQALGKLFPSRPRLHSSSRTDTGVHALGMVAHFEVPRIESKMSARRLMLAINAWLPDDIRVLAVSRAPASFHARFDAKSKEYRYFVWNHAGMNPLLRRSAWHVPRRLDLTEMRVAARSFVGLHDFTSLTSNPGYARDSTVRRLLGCRIRKQGPLLTFVIEGEGFLYRMCRGIVGTLVEVGLGKRLSSEIPLILIKKNRSAGGMSAPACGLVLWRVSYPPRARQRSAHAKQVVCVPMPKASS